MGAMTVSERLALRRGEIAANKSKGLRPYKFKAGTTKFRILPAKDADALWDRRFGVTYLKSFDSKSFVAIGDNEITYGTADPIRELLFEAMRAAPAPEVREHYQKMLASPRVLFQALILSDKDQDATAPVLIETSETAFDGILAQMEVWADSDPDCDLAGLATGQVFQVEKSGSGIDTKYVWTATPQKHPLVASDLDRLIDMDGWIAGQFEAKLERAVEFLSKLNASAGINIAIPSGLIGQAALPGTTPVAALPAADPAAGMVTTALEDDSPLPDEVIEDAVVEEIVADTPVTATIDPAVLPAAIATIEAQKAAAALATPTPKIVDPATDPVKPEPLVEPAAAVEGTALADILAQLK